MKEFILPFLKLKSKSLHFEVIRIPGQKDGGQSLHLLRFWARVSREKGVPNSNQYAIKALKDNIANYQIVRLSIDSIFEAEDKY